MEVVSIAKHVTDAVVRATVTKFSESKTQVEEVLQRIGVKCRKLKGEHEAWDRGEGTGPSSI